MGHIKGFTYALGILVAMMMANRLVSSMSYVLLSSFKTCHLVGSDFNIGLLNVICCSIHCPHSHILNIACTYLKNLSLSFILAEVSINSYSIAVTLMDCFSRI